MSQPTTGPAAEMPILWEHRETFSNVARPFRVVARDAATLSQMPLTEVPVDFRTQMVLVAAMGPTTSEEYGIRITQMVRQGGQIKATVVPVHPGQNKRGGVVVASPYHIVVVPKSDLNVAGFSSAVPPNAFRMTTPPGETTPPKRAGRPGR